MAKPAVYIGWSLGGLVASEIALNSPEKVKALPSSRILRETVEADKEVPSLDTDAAHCLVMVEVDNQLTAPAHLSPPSTAGCKCGIFDF